MDDKLLLPLLLKLCYVAAVFGGMVQAAGHLGSLGATSGQTGNLLRMGRRISQGAPVLSGQMAFDARDWKLAFSDFNMMLYFTVGNFVGGLWTCVEERKTMRTAGNALICSGLCVFLAGGMMYPKDDTLNLREASQLLCFAMGLMNAALVTTSGYANTVTTTGTLTDVGLLLGKLVNVDHRTADAFTKVVSLSLLASCFIFGSFLGGVVFYKSDLLVGARQQTFFALSVPACGLVLLGSAMVLRGRLAEMPSPEEEPLVAKPAPVQNAKPAAPAQLPSRFIGGAYLASLCAGMVDDGAYDLLGQHTPTHVTGPSVRLGVHAASVMLRGKEQAEFRAYAKLVALFLCGATLSGMVVRSTKRVTHFTASVTVIFVGVVLLCACFVHSYVPEIRTEMHAICGMSMGLQNGVITAVTGFARTTHVTGNLTNVGICLAQATIPGKATPALLFKLKANTILALAFMTGIVAQESIWRITMGPDPEIFRLRFLLLPAVVLVLVGLGVLLSDADAKRISRPGETEADSKEEDRRVSRVATAGGITDDISLVGSDLAIKSEDVIESELPIAADTESDGGVA